MKEIMTRLWRMLKDDVFIPVKKRMNPSMLRAARRLGVFIGWYFTVLRFGEIKLNDIYADELRMTMKTSFLCAEFITLAAITVALVFYDVEKMLTHKYIRYLPGVFLAEGSIALAVTDVFTVIPFSIIAGITSAIGSAAILTSLLKVTQRYRLAAIGGGIAVAGIIYIITCCLVPSLIENTTIAMLISGGLVALMTISSVHFEGFTGNKTKVIDKFDQEGRRDIVRKLPYEYVVFIVVCTAFFFAFNSSYLVADEIRPPTFHYFELVSMVALTITATVITLFVRPHSICPLFAGGAAVAGSAAILLNVHVVSGVETNLFAFFSYSGLACFRSCALLFVATFALNRPHPLFFSIVGYTAFIFSELSAQFLIGCFEPTVEKSILYTLIFFILLPIGYILISRGLARHGYSPDVLESQHRKRKMLRELKSQVTLSKRESDVAQYYFVDDMDIRDIQYKLYISEGAVNSSLKKIALKFGADSIQELKEKFKEVEIKEEQ